MKIGGTWGTQRWNAEAYKSFINLLKSHSDEAYGKFNSKIILDIGFSYSVRMPIQAQKNSEKVRKIKDFGKLL